MNKTQQQRYESLYEQHVNALKRQGKSESTIDVAYRDVSKGLRLGEALNLKVGDIDSQLMRIHLRKAKGKKALRTYWATHRNPLFLFPAGKNTDEQHHATVHMHRGGVQKSFQAIVRSAGIHKHVSIHTLRHCYGTHLVEVGLNLRAIQTEMGHECPKTTALYTQLTKTTQQNTRDIIDRMVERLSLTEEG